MTHENCTQDAIIPQDNSANYFSGEFPEFVSRDKDLNSRIIHNDANQSANSGIFRHRNNIPRFPDRIKSRIKSAFYAALERGRSIPNGSLLDREQRRKTLAYQDNNPGWLMSRYAAASGALAMLAVIGIKGKNGVLAQSLREWSDITGMNTRNVKRTARRLQEDGLLHVEERKVAGAKNDTNIYTIVSSQLLAWYRRLRCKWIGGRDRPGIEKEIESTLKPAPKTEPKPPPKTIAETEIALRHTGGSDFTDFLLAILAQTRGRRAIE